MNFGMPPAARTMGSYIEKHDGKLFKFVQICTALITHITIEERFHNNNFISFADMTQNRTVQGFIGSGCDKDLLLLINVAVHQLRVQIF